MAIEIVEADLGLPAHREAVLEMVDAYCQDPMGDGKPLSKEARSQLIPRLQEHPTTHIFLALEERVPVGVLVSFRGFSTFAAKPLINIHDIAVIPSHRGKGIGKKLLAAVEQKAKSLGCCKLTLEVQELNSRAQGVYTAFGFGKAVEAGHCLFLTKRL
jgi:GNAT superfamily N-acetyltransferase